LKTISDNRLILLVCLFSSLGFFSIDLITPSLPSMMESLHSGTGQIQSVVLIYILGLGISQFFYGPLGDKFGRRSVVIIGALICLIGNGLAIVSHSLIQLMMARFIGAFGGGAGMAISRVIFRDRFNGAKLIKASAYFTMSANISPAIAPFCGGLIEQHLGWRFAFLLLTIWAFIVLLTLIVGLPETHPVEKRTRHIDLKTMFHIYYKTLMNPHFTYSALISASSLASSISYLLISPFIYQFAIGLSPSQNGLVYLGNALSFLSGAFFVSRSRHRSHPRHLISSGLLICFCSSVLLLLGGLLHYLTVWSVLIPTMGNSLGLGMIMPTIAMLALSTIEQHIGMASALFTILRFIVLAICSLLVLPLGAHSQLPMAFLMLGFTLFSCFFYSRLP
jgi:Bcr/CflA subfamily drug resistance transporter